MKVNLTKSEFLYGNSEEAKQMRAKYGDDYKGYKKFFKANNPIDFSHQEQIEKKEKEYAEAKANLREKRGIWNRFKNIFSSNLEIARANNRGFSLSGTQRQQVLQSSGDGAVEALAAYQAAESAEDLALFSLNDATHGVNFQA